MKQVNIHTPEAPARRPTFDLRALWIGVAAGVTAILCCVSPVVLLGIALAMVVTYAALYTATGYLAVLGSHYHQR